MFLDIFDLSELPSTLAGVWDFLTEVLTETISHVDDALEAMLDVIGTINTVDLTANGIVTQFVGNIRYIIGNGLFVPLMTLVSLAYGVALWNLVLKLINAIKSAWKEKKVIKL